MDLTPLANALSGLGPWGIVIAVLLTAFGPKLLAKIKPLIPSSKPADSAPSTTAPSTTPLMDAAAQVLKALALKKYPYLSTDEAAHRFAGDLVKADDDAAVAKAAASAGAKTS